MKKAAVIIFCYNRPTHLKRLISVLKKNNERNYYFCSDGPKTESDKKNVDKVRKIIDNCKLNILNKKYLDSNIGIRQIFYIGLNFVFKYERKIIILEDDVIPSQSFFTFCDKLLDKYKNNLKISQIGGSNINDNLSKKNLHSYFFSKYSNIWGWATWANRWTDYDNNFTHLTHLLNSNNLKKAISNKSEYLFWKKYFCIHKKNKTIGTWDYAWTYTNFLKNRLSIVPKNNLINNIGFDFGSGVNPQKLKNLKKSQINIKLNHPKKIQRNLIYDQYAATNIYSIPNFWWRVKKKLLCFFNK